MFLAISNKKTVLTTGHPICYYTRTIAKFETFVTSVTILPIFCTKRPTIIYYLSVESYLFWLKGG